MQTKKANTLEIMQFTETAFGIIWGRNADRIVTLWNCPTFFTTLDQANKALEEFAKR